MDTAVSSALPIDKRGYFGVKSAWQYKAHAEKDLTKKKVSEEVTGSSKGYLLQLLKQGYAYRICIADNAPAKRKVQLESWFDEAIQTVAPGAPACKVLFAEESRGTGTVAKHARNDENAKTQTKYQKSQQLNPFHCCSRL